MYSTAIVILLINFLNDVSAFVVAWPRRNAQTCFNHDVISIQGPVTSNRRQIHYKDTSQLLITKATTSLTLDEGDLSNVAGLMTTFLSRSDAEKLMENLVLPKDDYGTRIQKGGDAQGLSPASLVKPDDPILEFTYGEFPLKSFDILIDKALAHLVGDQVDVNMVDLGSGCGRLVIYGALTRPGWTIHGIEISQLLHNLAVEALNRATSEVGIIDDDGGAASENITSVYLHHGPVEAYAGSILSEVNVVFAYSTVFPTRGFDPDVGAMIIGGEWSALLANSCKDGTVAVTTDRALDPTDGWNLVEVTDVENQEVMGSTGYIHILQKP